MTGGIFESVFYFAALVFIGLIAWIGQWGKRYDICRYIVYAMMGLSSAFLIALGVFFICVHPNMLSGLSLSMGLCAVPAFIPAVRRGLSKTVFKGLDVSNPTHTWALYIYFASIILTLFSLTVLYVPSLIIEELKTLPIYQMVIANMIVFVLFSFIAIGWGADLSFKQVAAKLGLTRLSRKQVGAMVVTALVMAFAIQFLEAGLMVFVPPVIRDTLQQIVKAMHVTGSVGYTLRSACIVGLGAGIGEEILFRGLMQPLFGLVPTALLFALIHTHYGPTVLLLELFVVGLILGYIRNRWNTTAAIIVHGGFDCFAILSSLLHH